MLNGLNGYKILKWAIHVKWEPDDWEWNLIATGEMNGNVASLGED